MNSILIKRVIKVIKRMKKIVCAVSVRLAVSNEHLKEKTNIIWNLQEQLINYFGLKVVSTACELVQHSDKWDDSNWTLNLTHGFIIQFDISRDLV